MRNSSRRSTACHQDICSRVPAQGWEAVDLRTVSCNDADLRNDARFSGDRKLKLLSSPFHTACAQPCLSSTATFPFQGSREADLSFHAQYVHARDERLEKTRIVAAPNSLFLRFSVSYMVLRPQRCGQGLSQIVGRTQESSGPLCWEVPSCRGESKGKLGSGMHTMVRVRWRG